MCNGLVCQSLVSGEEIDDAAVGKTVFEDVVLHDSVVPMRVYADIPVPSWTLFQAGPSHWSSAETIFTRLN